MIFHAQINCALCITFFSTPIRKQINMSSKKELKEKIRKLQLEHMITVSELRVEVEKYMYRSHFAEAELRGLYSKKVKAVALAEKLVEEKASVGQAAQGAHSMDGTRLAVVQIES